MRKGEYEKERRMSKGGKKRGREGDKRDNRL
jgi:hypothetical protein